MSKNSVTPVLSITRLGHKNRERTGYAAHIDSRRRPRHIHAATTQPVIAAARPSLSRRQRDAGRSLDAAAVLCRKLRSAVHRTVSDRPVRSGSPEDVAILLAYARKVVIVPGYGLAVAQGQHTVRELADLLGERGVDVVYGIHPVAGRMPGHMNVLLAEANVPYDALREAEEVNPQLASTDVALVVGANNVVNPAARTDPTCPIYGMPILDVGEAANVVFLKRSMRPGFAGIDNELLYQPNTTLLFGDAKDSLTKVVAAVRVPLTAAARRRCSALSYWMNASFIQCGDERGVHPENGGGCRGRDATP